MCITAATIRTTSVRSSKALASAATMTVLPVVPLITASSKVLLLLSIPVHMLIQQPLCMPTSCKAQTIPS